MSKLFFEDLEMAKPDAYLNVGSGTHAQQTAKIMEKYEEYIMQNKPDHVIVCGDVNTTLACALVSAKLNIPVSHIEAGLRSFDKTMPEEINRLLTDMLSDMLFITSNDAKENLAKEGISDDKVYFVGNIMIDSLVTFQKKAESSDIINRLRIDEDYALVTLHRPSNVDTREGLNTLLVAFFEIAKKIKLVFPVHPRTIKNMKDFGMYEKVSNNIILTEPLGYLDFLKLQSNAKFLLTDSGGIQSESTYLQIPCLTLRDRTELNVTVDIGTNQLVKLTTQDIIDKAEEILSGRCKKGNIPPLWDGKTAERIVKVFLNKFAK
jgi:UDP-N-acetylglucosamine 2-epimerase (non-hydrolysing)